MADQDRLRVLREDLLQRTGVRRERTSLVGAIRCEAGRGVSPQEGATAWYPASPRAGSRWRHVHAESGKPCRQIARRAGLGPGFEHGELDAACGDASFLQMGGVVFHRRRLVSRPVHVTEGESAASQVLRRSWVVPVLERPTPEVRWQHPVRDR